MSIQVRGLSWAAALLTAMVSTGCYKATFVAEPGAAKRAPDHEEWEDHYLFGTTGKTDIDVQRYCPNGVGAVRTGGNAGTTTLSIVTLGVYTPRKVYIACSDPARMTARMEDGK